MKRYFFLCHICGHQTENEDAWHAVCDHCGYGKWAPKSLSEFLLYWEVG